MVEWYWILIAIALSSACSLVVIGLVSSGVRADLESKIFDKDQVIFEQKSEISKLNEEKLKLKSTIEFLEINFDERLNGLINLASSRKNEIDRLNLELKNKQSVINAMRDKYESKEVNEAC